MTLSNNNLSGKSISWLSGLLPQITTLDISGNNLGDMDLKQFNLNNTLKNLNVSNNNITDSSFLAKMPKLINLDISHNPINNSVFSQAVANHKSLQDLNASYCQLDDTALEWLSIKTPMERLNLSHNNFTEAGMPLLIHAKINILFLDNNNLGDQAAELLSKNVFFEALSLSNNKITDNGIVFFCDRGSLQEGTKFPSTPLQPSASLGCSQ